MDLPPLPEIDDETEETPGIALAAKLMIAAGVAVVALLVVLHLTGVLGGSQLH